MTPQEMEKIIDDAGIFRTEATKLFEVTRQTLANWLAGKPRKNEYLFRRASGIAMIIRKATEKGYFPLDADTPQKERFRLISERIKFVVREG